MCNEFKTPDQLAKILVLANAITVMPEAEKYQPRSSVRPSDPALIIWEAGSEAFLGVATFGYPKRASMGKGLILNARSESITTTWPWRDMIPCWLVATSWIEYPEVEGKGMRTELGLPGGDPFLLAGVCETRSVGRRMAMQMQEPPARLAHIGDRLPLPYGFEALGSIDPRHIIERIEVIR